jgi:hypothetical protein
MSSKQRSAGKRSSKIHCCQCDKVISTREEALFVEEEVGRVFCEEGCIVAHFTPEIEKLEREYGKHVSPDDLSSGERERFAHFRWMALENPDEIWMEQTPKGDHRYTLVSEYSPEQKKVWAVATCLMLRGEPSFLYLAFVTADRNLVDVFRRGDRMQVARGIAEAESGNPVSEEVEAPMITDRLAEAWTESDSIRALILKGRKESDIPPEDFGFYQKCLEETLQTPNELWSYLPKSAKRIYHFIKRYDHDSPFWYVVIAKDAADESQIEIIDVFPTRDQELIQLCRHGKKEPLGGSGKGEGLEESSLLPEKVRKNVH